MDSRYDAVIMGGGLAGLTLARQLHLEAPQLRVLVCEKRRHPVREAAFKVGESSVEIGAHYFQKRLGLEPLLCAEHLPKFGLRYFFPCGDNRDITRRVELGPPLFPRVPSFQLDRGRFENSLLRMVRESGVEVLDGCRVRTIDLADAPADAHSVTVETPAGIRTARARWLVDASGRAGLLKRQLGLSRPASHGANACWWRVSERVKVDDWSDDPAWRARVPLQQRWLSTNHLMGKGYWVWLIPLGSGSTSFGIVADANLHPFNRLNRFERALDWLREYEPQCADVAAPYASRLDDFLALQHFAHGCERVFSPNRWAMTGESGVFTDPFYSPGSDFIALGNDFITDLITSDARGEDITARAETFNITHLRLFDAFLKLYDGQYPLMGSAQVATAKVAWDNGAYWAVTALLFFQRRFRQPEFMASIDGLLRRFFVLHARMQQLFNAWGRFDTRTFADATLTVMNMEKLRQLQDSLDEPIPDDEALRQRLHQNVAWLEAFARGWQATAMEVDPALAGYVSMGDAPVADVSPLRLTPVPTSVPAQTRSRRSPQSSRRRQRSSV